MTEPGNQIPINRMSDPSRPRPGAAAVSLTPKEIFRILRQHILLIISLTILGLIVGGVGWYLLKKYFPLYTAATVIRVLPPGEKDPMTIGGRQAAKDIMYGARLSMATLIKQQGTLMSLLNRVEVQETKWFKNFGDIKAVQLRKAIGDLKKRFGATPARDGDFIFVSMKCRDPKEAAAIVNEMVKMFVASQGVIKREEVSNRLTKMKEQQVRLRNELNFAEKALDNVRQATNFTDLEQRSFRSAIEERLARHETEQSGQVQRIRAFQARIEVLQRLADEPVNVQTENQIERDPVLLMLTQRIVLQDMDIAARLSKFGENHRTIRLLRDRINETRLKRQDRRILIAEQIRQSNLINAQDQLTILEKSLDELEKLRAETVAKKKELDLARVQYEKRVTVRDGIVNRLEDVKQLIEKMTIMHNDPETPKVQWVVPAPVPFEVSSPKWQVFFPCGFTLGFMLGVGLAFLIELLNDLVRSPRDVVRYLHIPLLGVIPHADEDEQTEGADLYNVVRLVPYSVISGAYKLFRTNLKLSDAAKSSKVVLISSGAAEDGKTSVAVNLATTFIAENKKILLIDANFWRPALYKIFSLPTQQQQQPEGKKSKKEKRDKQPPDIQPEFGLGTFLTGLCGYSEVIRSTGIEGFDVIDAGIMPPNPEELLGSTQMEQLLKQQKQNYDYIIIDGPPVLVVSDVKVLANLVDGTVLVFNAANTRRGAALRSIRELRQGNALVIGCVLLGVKRMKGGYFQEQFRNYQEYQKLQFARAT